MKIKLLKISNSLLVDFLKRPSGAGISQEGMPEDAVIVDARFDPARDVVELKIKSDSFPDIDSGSPVPYFSLVFKKQHTFKESSTKTVCPYLGCKNMIDPKVDQFCRIHQGS